MGTFACFHANFASTLFDEHTIDDDVAAIIRARDRDRDEANVVVVKHVRPNEVLSRSASTSALLPLLGLRRWPGDTSDPSLVTAA